MGYYDNPKWDKNKMVVPFDLKGNLTNYTYNANWSRVFPFKSTMKIVDYGNTTGSATFDLEDENGSVYPIYVSDLLKVLQTRNVTNGAVEETMWTFKKQGMKYSIKLFEE